MGAAVAAPALNAQSHEHVDKRDVVTTTVIVDASGNPIETPNADNKAAAINENMVAGTTATPVAAATTAAAAPTTAAGTESSSSSSSSGSSGSSGSAASVGAAGVRGITYSPYNADGTCKSADQVASDFSQLQGYSNIRLYGVDCNQVENVLKAKSSSQKLFLGIYFVDQIQAGVDTMKAAIDAYGSWNDVTTVSIGNELVNGNQASPSQVGSYVAQGRAALAAAGYNGPVVSVDTFIAVINNPELCQYSDYMAVNAHAFFDQNTAAADSGKWLLQQIQRVWTACDGKKDVVITESGWPSRGDTYGIAVPSKANQKAAVDSITQVCGSSTYLFTAFNDYWKADGFLNCEKYWGVLDN